MKQLIFSTGNTEKFGMGQTTCQKYDIELIQSVLDIDEIQSDNIEYVARRKAEAAFAMLKKPIVTSDDAWEIPGLNGFPGTYVKYINDWFTADDWIRLTRDLENREATIVQTIVYQDEHTQKFFIRRTTGVLLKEPRGNTGRSIQQVVSFEPDKKTSISEIIGSGTYYSGEGTLRVWHDLAQWLTNGQKS